MWLINVNTFKLEEFYDAQAPKYAILSHTWGSEEACFQEMAEDYHKRATLQQKAGFRKISECSSVASALGFSYVWIDTCCIDKRNSADLSEAINSMYSYYRRAAACLIYLVDVPGRISTLEEIISRPAQFQAIRSSRWLTRGWTLQELIAPSTRHFFAGDWSPIALVEDGQDLMELISEITKIDLHLLRHEKDVSRYCVAERMSWASERKTTRSEDTAYSLIGLFNVNMPMLYGEGGKNAFRRLQKEILQTSADQTLFAWRGNYLSSGLLANSPADFANTPRLSMWAPDLLEPFSMTNLGLSIGMIVKHDLNHAHEGVRGSQEQSRHALAVPQCNIKVGQEWRILVLHLEQVASAKIYINGKSCKAYRRVKCDEWITSYPGVPGWPYEHILVLDDEHFGLVMQSLEEHLWRSTYDGGSGARISFS
jgi:hypothetical protein